MVISLGVIIPLSVIVAILAIIIVLYYTNSTVRYYIKCFFFAINFVCVTFGGMLIILFSYLTPNRKDGSVVRFYFKNIWQKLTGIKVEIEGEELLDPKEGRRPCVYMYNHQSTLDLLMIVSFMPEKNIILCKKSLKSYPFVGQYLQVTGAYFLDRKNSTSAIDTMKKAAQYIKKHSLSVIMAPEGTRSNLVEPDLLPLKKGGFHLAIQAQCPIIPIVIPNYPTVGIYNSRRKIFNNGKLKIKVLPPISVEGYTSDDVTPLLDKVRNTMLEGIKEVTKESIELNNISGKNKEN